MSVGAVTLEWTRIEKASGLDADHAVFAAVGLAMKPADRPTLPTGSKLATHMRTVGAAAALFVAVGLLRRARNISLQHPVAGVTPAPLSLV